MSEIQLDERGVLVDCHVCGQRNRLLYDRLHETVRCPTCKSPLAPPSEPIDVSRTSEFDALVTHASLPVLVDYWAEWCGPCRMVAPEIRKVADSRAVHAVVAKVNAAKLPEVSERYRVQSLPTLAVFARGHEIARTVGAGPAREIEALLDRAAAHPDPSPSR